MQNVDFDKKLTNVILELNISIDKLLVALDSIKELVLQKCDADIAEKMIDVLENEYVIKW